MKRKLWFGASHSKRQSSRHHQRQPREDQIEDWQGQSQDSRSQSFQLETDAPSTETPSTEAPSTEPPSTEAQQRVHISETGYDNAEKSNGEGPSTRPNEGFNQGNYDVNRSRAANFVQDQSQQFRVVPPKDQRFVFKSGVVCSSLLQAPLNQC